MRFLQSRQSGCAFDVHLCFFLSDHLLSRPVPSVCPSIHQVVLDRDSFDSTQRSRSRGVFIVVDDLSVALNAHSGAITPQMAGSPEQLVALQAQRHWFRLQENGHPILPIGFGGACLFASCIMQLAWYFVNVFLHS